MHWHISTPRPVVAAVRRTVTGAVARTPQGRHGLRCPKALPAPHGQPIAQAPAGEKEWTTVRGGRTLTANPRPGPAPSTEPRKLRTAVRDSLVSKQEGDRRHRAPYTREHIFRPSIQSRFFILASPRWENGTLNRTAAPPLPGDRHVIPEVGVVI